MSRHVYKKYFVDKIFVVISLLATTLTQVHAAADYMREQRWADEITPSILVGEPIYLSQKNQHRFLGILSEADDTQTGLIIVHGMGIHPDWGLISTLRQQLNEAGYTTLSIQMPVLEAAADYTAYLAVYPEAVERLQIATHYLQQKGYQRLIIVSHSNGSRMGRVYMEQNPPAIKAWVALSLTQGDTYAGIKAPVLDLYGDNDLPHVLAAAKQRKDSFQNPASLQQVIPHADHFFNDHEAEMVTAVKNFIQQQPLAEVSPISEPTEQDPTPFCPSWD